MILTADYHTHTPYSHGKGSVLVNATHAQEKGLKEIGITDHGFAHIAFGIRRKKLQALIEDCKTAENKTGVKVLVGIEANILGVSGKSDLTQKDYENFDLFIAGKHVFVAYENLSAWCGYFARNFLTDKLRLTPSKKLIEYNTKAYINVIKNNPVDIISHLGYKCPADYIEVAKCAADYGTYVEINTKKTHLSDEVWQEIADRTSVRFVIDSDAHTPDRVGDTCIAEELFSRVNFPQDRIDNIDGRTPVFRFQAYKKNM